MQFPARIPITVALIGTCAITRNSVAPRPNRGACRRSHPEHDRNRLGPGPASVDAPFATGWTRQASPRAGRRGTLLTKLGSFAHGCAHKQGVLPPRIDGMRSAHSQLPMVERDAKLGVPLDEETGARFACLSDRTPHQGLRGWPGTVPCFDDRGNPMCNFSLEFQ